MEGACKWADCGHDPRLMLVLGPGSISSSFPCSPPPPPVPSSVSTEMDFRHHPPPPLHALRTSLFNSNILRKGKGDLLTWTAQKVPSKCPVMEDLPCCKAREEGVNRRSTMGKGLGRSTAGWRFDRCLVNLEKLRFQSGRTAESMAHLEHGRSGRHI